MKKFFILSNRDHFKNRLLEIFMKIEVADNNNNKTIERW